MNDAVLQKLHQVQLDKRAQHTVVRPSFDAAGPDEVLG